MGDLDGLRLVQPHRRGSEEAQRDRGHQYDDHRRPDRRSNRPAAGVGSVATVTSITVVGSEVAGEQLAQHRAESPP